MAPLRPCVVLWLLRQLASCLTNLDRILIITTRGLWVHRTVQVNTLRPFRSSSRLVLTPQRFIPMDPIPNICPLKRRLHLCTDDSFFSFFFFLSRSPLVSACWRMPTIDVLYFCLLHRISYVSLYQQILPRR
jgi:hypothetical protein